MVLEFCVVRQADQGNPEDGVWDPDLRLTISLSLQLEPGERKHLGKLPRDLQGTVSETWRWYGHRGGAFNAVMDVS